MSRYFERYDQFGEERGSLFEAPMAAAKPFNQEAYQRLLDAVAIAGAEYALWRAEQRRLRTQKKGTPPNVPA